VPLNNFANPESLHVDGVVRGVGEGGQRIAARVAHVGPDSVTLDFNHPLAGKTLVFDITITEVVPPAKGAKS
jgi:FKBP-type peptidyl-prolyl cis-trans isomerase SlyD